MNHIYKVVFCKTTGTFVAVAEYAKAQGKKSSGTVGSVSSASDSVAKTGKYLMFSAISSAMLLMSGNVLAATGTNATGGLLPAASAQTGSGANWCYYDVGTKSVICGDSTTTTTSSNTVTLGTGASTAANNQIAIGNGAKANAIDSSVVIGNNAGNTSYTTGNIGSTIIGHNAHSSANATLALGAANTTADNAIAIGSNGNSSTFLANASANGAIAFGNGTNASGISSLAMGRQSQASAAGAQAIGQGAQATGLSSNAIGAAQDYNASGGAKALGNYSNAIGYNTTVSSNNATALGSNITIASGNNGAVVIGDNSTYTAPTGTGYLTGQATPTSQVSIGGGSAGLRRITNVADGSAGSDAVTVNQLTNLNTNLSNAITTNSNAITTNANNISKLGTNTASALGGGSSYNSTTGTLTAPSYTVNSAVYNDVGSAISALNTNVNSNAAQVNNTYFHVNTGANTGTGNSTNNLGKITDAAGATGTGAITSGMNARADGVSAVAIGNGATVTAKTVNGYAQDSNYSVAIGNNAKAVLGTTGSLTANNASVPGGTAGGATAIGHDAYTLTGGAVAVGAGHAKATNSIAIGAQSGITDTGVYQNASYSQNYLATTDGQRLAANTAQSAYSSDGYAAVTNSDGALAIGNFSTATGTSSQAIGRGAYTNGEAAQALGQNAIAKGKGAVAIGGATDINPNTGQGNVVGAQAFAQYGLAIGGDAQVDAGADFGIALGKNSEAFKAQGIAIGYNANAGSATSAGTDNIAIGNGAIATGDKAISIGYGNKVSGNNSGAIGDPSYITGAGTYTVGNNNGTSASPITAGNSGAFGNNNMMTGTDTQAGSRIIGNNNNVTTDNTFVLGNGIGTNNTANGASVVPTLANSVYLGSNTTAVTGTGNNVTASNGAGATTTGGATGTVSSATLNGITYGNFAGQTSVGAVTVGAAGAERRISNVAAGQIAATSTDAINGSQLYITNNTLGNLAQSTATNLGGGTTVGTNGTLTAPTYTIYTGNTNPITTGNSTTAFGSPANNVGSAINNLNTYVNQGFNVKDNAGTTQGIVTPTESVQFVNGTGTNSTVTTEANGVTKVQYDLAAATQTSLGKADTAIQSFTTSVGGTAVETIDQTNKDINFVNGTGTTARASGSDITFDVKTDGVTTQITNGNVSAVTAPITSTNGVASTTGNTSSLATAGDVVNAVNNSGFTLTAQGANGGLVKPGSTVDMNNTDGNIVISKNATDNNVSYNLAPVVKIGTTSPVTINGNNGTITGLTNTTFDPTTTYTGGQAATQEQLSSANNQLNSTLTTKGMDYMGDSGTVVHRDLGTQVNVKGGATGTLTTGNIGVAADGTDTLNVQLAKDVNLGTDGSLTAGNTVLNNTGLTINGGTNPVTLTNTGLNNGGNTITNVAAGVNNTDAVNVSQLNAVAANAKTTSVVKGTNVASVTNVVNGNNTEYTINADGTTVSAGSNAVSVIAGTKDANNVTDYKVDLTQATKDSLVNADSAVQTVVTQVNGTTVKTLDKTNNTANFVTGDNMVLSDDGNGGIKVATAKDVTFDSVIAGNSITAGTGANQVILNNAGVNVGGNNYISGNGINANNQAITNVLAGVNDTDAVNVSQLNNAQAAATTKVVAGAGNAVIGNPNADGSTTYTVSTKTDGVTTQIDANGNVSAITSPLTNATNGSINTPTSPNALATAGDVANAVNNSGFTLTAQGANGSLVKPGSTVDMKNNDGNLVIAKSATDNTVTYDLAKNIKVDSVAINNSGVTLGNTGLNNGGNTITNVAAGVNNTDAVNVSQLNAVAANAKTSSVAAGTNVASVDKVVNGINTEYTVNAKGAKVSTDTGLEVTPSDAGDNVTDYKVALSQTTKDSLTNADTALQSVVTQIDGTEVKTLTKTNNTANFVTGDNMVLSDDGNGGIKVATAKDVNFNTVTTSGLTVNPNSTVNMGGNVVNNVASGLQGKTLDQIKAEGNTSPQWNNAVNVGDLTQVQSNVTNVQQIVGGVDISGNVADGNGDTITYIDGTPAPITAAEALRTYDAAGVGTVETNSVLTAIKNVNEQGTKYIHFNGGERSVGGVRGQNVEQSQANGAKSTAIGYQTIADGDGSVAIGNVADAIGNHSIAIGDNAKALGEQSISIGTGNVVTGNNSGAIGDPNTISGNNSYALGNTNNVFADNSFAIANNATITANANGATALGNNTTVNVAGGVALGENSVANRAGLGATVTTSSSTADPTQNQVYALPQATSADRTAIIATAQNSAGAVSVGTDGANRQITHVAAGSLDDDAVNVAQLKAAANTAAAAAVAAKTTLTNGSNTTVNPTANADGSTNYTVDVNADGTTITTIDGKLTAVTASLTNTATGGVNTPASPNALATAGDVATVVNNSGFTLTAQGANGSLVKPGSTVNMQNTDGNIVVSKSATSNAVNYDLARDIKVDSVGINNSSVALSNTGLNNGGNTITNVAAGVNATDAVNVGQLNTLGNNVNNAINQMGYKIGDVEQNANAGISGAMAMAALPQAYLPGKSMLAGGLASYNGEGAAAIGVSKLSDNGRWVIKVNGTADTQGNYGGAVGAGFHW